MHFLVDDSIARETRAYLLFYLSDDFEKQVLWDNLIENSFQTDASPFAVGLRPTALDVELAISRHFSSLGVRTPETVARPSPI
jgi:hypothetical protein